MASKIKVTRQKVEMLEKEGPETPLLDLSDAAVKALIRSAKKRGYVTHDQINALPSSDETEEAEPENERAREEPDDEEESEGELVEVKPKLPAKSGAKDPAERTGDPVRMYLREMSSVDLLSRDGEIAIAKRIEAGREAMIAGLCESPLTFQAVIIWRDELNDGKVFLRDIIDLEATYAGPDAKQMQVPVIIGPDGKPIPVAVVAVATVPGAPHLQIVR
jgi:RNA polymerase primary sigma factor